MLRSKALWNYEVVSEEKLEIEDDTLSVSPIVKALLIQRDIKTAEAAKKFLEPDLSQLLDPLKLDSIEIACARIKQAIAVDEKILVLGDYDADGVTSTTLLLETLQTLDANCDFYIPNRFTEGYGPNEAAFREAYDNGFRLVITVDNGIAAVHEAKIAKEIGLDLIITDHHEVQVELPDAYAIVHPKCSDAYAFKELAGVGVALKLSECLLGYFPKEYLDLVAIGTIADLVPLVEENRVLTYFGLKALTNTNRVGLQALKNLCKISGDVSEEDVGFLIGPRINAVGRLQDADLAVQLMLTKDQSEAEEIAEMIDALNQERQKIVEEIFKEAETMVGPPNEQGVIIVCKAGWNEGVLGIVASKLVRKFDRPAICLTVKGDQIKGSARSIQAFDLFENGMKVRDLFTHFGGHAQAAGMTLPKGNLEKLQDALNALIHEQLDEADFKQVIQISKTLQIDEMTEALVDEITLLAPFGMANTKPIFEFSGIPSDVRQLGNAKNHLKLAFTDSGQALEAIGFGLGEIYPFVSPKTAVTIVGKLGINEWNGNKKIQIVVEDFKIEAGQLFDHRGRKDTNITSYINKNEQQLIICNDASVESIAGTEQIEYINYQTHVNLLTKMDTLYLFDLPPDLDQLQAIMKATRPDNIHACFYVENTSYLTEFPTREMFKAFYAYIWQKKSVTKEEAYLILLNQKGWTKERVSFIGNVFEELEFIQTTATTIEICQNPEKRDLQESGIYQARLKQAEVEKVLYYSTYDELKTWFINSGLTALDTN